jgi:hypothetical protein
VNGLAINLIKCTFMVPEQEVLGHIINKSGTNPTPQHIQVIIEYPPPQDVKQLQRYLGMVNFYLRFTPGIAAVLELPTAALKGGKDTGMVSGPRQRFPAQQTGTRRGGAAGTPRTKRGHRPGHGRIRHPHRWRTPTTGTGVLATIGFLFLQGTACRIEILNV